MTAPDQTPPERPKEGLEQQTNYFDPVKWDGWAYPGAADQNREPAPAYARDVSYVDHTGIGVPALEKANRADASKAKITPTSYSLTMGGLYVGVIILEDRGEKGVQGR